MTRYNEPRFELLEIHKRALKQRGIPPEFAMSHGVFSESYGKILAKLAGVKRWTHGNRDRDTGEYSCCTLVFAFPLLEAGCYPTSYNTIEYAAFRPDYSPTGAKYICPWNEDKARSNFRIYIPPEVMQKCKKGPCIVVVVEGILTCLFLLSRGILAIAILGHTMWGHPVKKIGQRDVHSDFLTLLPNAQFLTMPDVDKKLATRRKVFGSFTRMAARLKANGAKVSTAYPDKPEGEEWKVDDWLNGFPPEQQSAEWYTLMKSSREPDQERPQLKSQDYCEVADEVIAHFSDDAQRPLIVRHREVTYEWVNGLYLPKSKEETEALYGGVVEANYSNAQKSLETVCNAVNRKILLPNSLKAPCWVNDSESSAKYPADECIVLQNGILHTLTLEFSDLDPNLFATATLDFDYTEKVSFVDGVATLSDEDAPQRWIAFLDKVLKDDAQAVATLQEFSGLYLTCITRFQKALLLVGPPGCGKGTIARVLRYLVGLLNTRYSMLNSFCGTFGLEPLIGVLLDIIPEITERGNELTKSLGYLYALIGEDDLSVNRKFSLATEGLFARFLMLANAALHVNDPGGAFDRRIIAIQMNQQFKDADMLADDDLALLADSKMTLNLLKEREQIFNWAIVGLHRLLKRGYFIQPESGKEIKQIIREGACLVKTFGKETCHFGADFSVPKIVLYERFKLQCRIQGERCCGFNQFTTELKAAFPRINTKAKSRKGFNGKQQVSEYAGLTLRREPDLLTNEVLKGDTDTFNRDPQYPNLLAWMRGECRKYPAPDIETVDDNEITVPQDYGALPYWVSGKNPTEQLEEKPKRDAADCY